MVRFLGKDQSGLSRADRVRALKAMEARANREEIDRGQNGKHPNSVAAFKRYRCELPHYAGKRCAGKRFDGQRCGKPALRGATLCELHGGIYQVPKHPAAVRAFKKHLQSRREANAIRKQVAAFPAEIKETVASVAPVGTIDIRTVLEGCIALIAYKQGDQRAWPAFLRTLETVAKRAKPYREGRTKNIAKIQQRQAASDQARETRERINREQRSRDE